MASRLLIRKSKTAGAMLSPRICNESELWITTAKACGVCKDACFRGGIAGDFASDRIRESMAPTFPFLRYDKSVQADARGLREIARSDHGIFRNLRHGPRAFRGGALGELVAAPCPRAANLLLQIDDRLKQL